MSNENKRGEWRRTLVSIALGVLIIALAVVASLGLAARRKPPVQAEIAERAIRVDVMSVRHEDVPVWISGYGEARARDEVALSPEVSGRVESVHPRLEVGEVIPTGEPLFTIDNRDYRARVSEAQANVAQWTATIDRLQKQFATDKERLPSYASTRDLAKRDYERALSLFKDQNIESESFVGDREAEYNQAQDAYNQFAQTIELYPLRIEEARSSLAAAQAALDRAQSELDRTVVAAPFDARLKEVDIESGEWVTPGTRVLTLADDSTLQIAVPLNSQDVSNWIQFESETGKQNRAWFRDVKPVPVEVAWSEGLSTNVWQGTLDRVVRYDEETRTVTVMVSVTGAEARTPRAGSLPLVEGMFCRIRIPGKTATSVVRLPAESVGFDADASGMRTVYLAAPDKETAEVRLATRKVKESHADGQFVYVSEGLEDGEQVVVTRLVNPLERTLLNVQETVAP
jgi:RND family efflux transporter MFP subunit